MPLLYLFIENYKKCSIPAIKSFASGLKKDIDAVENTVASELSNGLWKGLTANKSGQTYDVWALRKTIAGS